MADDRSVQVTRSVEVDADLDAVWEAVADPGERASWLDDPDARAREVRIDEAAPGERLVWTWWHRGDEGDATTVSVVLRPVDGGGTRVHVTETLPAVPPVVARGGLEPQASLLAGASVVAAAGAGSGSRARPPAWVGCTYERWGSRLLGLELLFVAAGARVA